MEQTTAITLPGSIEDKIYLLRGKKVMLDSDLARLYGGGTRVLNQSVKHNHDRFPEDSMFHLTREEIMNLSQFVISPRIRHAPHVLVLEPPDKPRSKIGFQAV